MNNATTLIDGLSGERVRWTEASKGFEAETGRLVGDVLLATGFLSYSGPFNQEFRNTMMKNWKTELRKKSIPYSAVSNLDPFQQLNGINQGFFSTVLEVLISFVDVRHKQEQRKILIICGITIDPHFLYYEYLYFTTKSDSKQANNTNYIII